MILMSFLMWLRIWTKYNFDTTVKRVEIVMCRHTKIKKPKEVLELFYFHVMMYCLFCLQYLRLYSQFPIYCLQYVVYNFL